MKTIVSQKLSVHMEHELLLRLEAAGLNKELAQEVINSKDNDLATKVVRLIQNRGFEPSASHKRARAIMGENFFGVEEAIKHFGVNPSRQQLACLAEIPFTEEILNAYRYTRVLAAVFPVSIDESIVCMHGKALFYRHLPTRKLFNQPFTKDKGEIKWQLVRMVPVEGSMNETWDDQQTLLSPDDETPKAQVIVYTIVGHLLATGKPLFENTCVRCSDLDSDGNRVYVGYAGGLVVNSYRDSGCDGNLGVSAARKQ